jgi:hypothetical protein
MLDVMSRRDRIFCLWTTSNDFLLGIFRSALPEFKALEEFEWIGYPELQADMVKVLLKSHPSLARLGLMYFPTAYRFTSGH